MKTKTIYFFHPSDVGMMLAQIEANNYPRHLLYGALGLSDYNINVIFHKHKYINNRLKKILVTTWKILTCREHFDILYGYSFPGLELFIFLRALGLYPHPIVIWHHTPITKANNWFRERLARFFYHGIDKMFFFSDHIMEVSLLSQKARPEKMVMARWGADLAFYDYIKGKYAQETENSNKIKFISTGKEKRVLFTLITAFEKTGRDVDIYLSRKTGKDNYEEMVLGKEFAPNIKVHICKNTNLGDLAKKVAQADCVCICCKETNYTVGLTTLVEAMALGKTIICSDNPNFPMKLAQNNAGIMVPYGDIEAWKNAIEYVCSHPTEAQKMGKNARLLAESSFNP